MLDFKEILKADLLLITTAVIWGFAFVFQTLGLEFIGPITFVFFRFLIASIIFLVLFKFGMKNESKLHDSSLDYYSIILGIIMVIGMLFQQIGLQSGVDPYGIAPNFEKYRGFRVARTH